uniref:Uncharacterized protein n=1 Tax=Steinernema glaseri TaxID=37863 RepID=A0A1I8AFU6_9BILA
MSHFFSVPAKVGTTIETLLQPMNQNKGYKSEKPIAGGHPTRHKKRSIKNDKEEVRRWARQWKQKILETDLQQVIPTLGSPFWNEKTERLSLRSVTDLALSRKVQNDRKLHHKPKYAICLGRQCTAVLFQGATPQQQHYGAGRPCRLSKMSNDEVSDKGATPQRQHYGAGRPYRLRHMSNDEVSDKGKASEKPWRRTESLMTARRRSTTLDVYRRIFGPR